MKNSTDRIPDNMHIVSAAIESIYTHGRYYCKNEIVVLEKNRKKKEIG